MLKQLILVVYQDRLHKYMILLIIALTLALITILPLLSFLIGGVTLDFEMPKLKQLATTSFIFEG